MKLLLSFLLLLTTYGSLVAQRSEPEFENSVNLLFGLNQVAIGGFNIEANLFVDRFSFDYSHGVNLMLTNNRLEAGADKEQNLDIILPWTTGFGAGYRFDNWFNVRVEPKWHKWGLYDAGAAQHNANLLGSYTTFTLGLGAYANWRPFKRSDNLLRGIMIVPSLRWWPKLSSSLDNDELRYTNPTSEQTEVHQAREIGFGNTAFFGSISVGYSMRF